LAAVDETVLALVDLALERRRSITIVYPAPAGEVSVLLAGEILIRRFVEGERSQSVGIVTSDTTRATTTWEELAISSLGSRTPISEVFPAFRAGPDGESPLGGRSFRGAMIGRRFGGWPIDVAVVDHLAGPVRADPLVPTVQVFADALDPELERLASDGALVWGWTEADLALVAQTRHDRPSAVPFSVAAERLETMAAGVKTTIHVAHHSEAEQTVRRLRDDLHALRDLAGPEPPPSILRGIRVAWHHVSTLTSLPSRPSLFDRFAGLPPVAARATRTFEPEIAAWARTLSGDLREVAEVVASDLADLRAFLEDTDPFGRELAEAVSGGADTLVVVRTQTAARALLASVGGDPATDLVGSVRVVAMRRLHREGTWPRAVVVGTPARWDWHRLDSGLSPDVHVLVLGDLDAYLGLTTLEALHRARARWGGEEVRDRAWRELVGGEPPLAPKLPAVQTEVVVVDALEATPEIDPFEALQQLLASVPLAVGDEGVEDAVGEELAGGEWRGAVEAIEVLTSVGAFLLPRDRLTDVRAGEEIVECRAGLLRPGMVLLVDRRGGRIGLLEAIGDRLKKERPDLLAANLLIGDLRRTVQQRFVASGMTRMELFERLRSLGFEKTYHAARTYVDEDGPLAPRDFVDLQRLNGALGLGMSEERLRETFGGVRRWRAFRRAAGKALMTASRGSLVTSEATRIDRETGLSIADLRELVLEAEVLDVRECPEPVALAEIGYLREP
ncbi:MAG: hypothetical protein M3P43_14225, partial [Actinomycetota bacterium]|nr:hypothetical protein [Actinomycetota bacterium]